jgi:hypothetical protein
LNLGIVGSRKLEGSAAAYRIIHEYLVALHPDKVVSGGAVGIDNMGMEVALGLGYSEDDLIIHLPKPRSHARWDYVAALFERNSLIVEDSDELLALMVPGGSRGTEDTIEKAKRKFIFPAVVTVD